MHFSNQKMHDYLIVFGKIKFLHHVPPQKFLGLPRLLARLPNSRDRDGKQPAPESASRRTLISKIVLYLNDDKKKVVLSKKCAGGGKLLRIKCLRENLLDILQPPINWQLSYSIKSDN